MNGPELPRLPSTPRPPKASGSASAPRTGRFSGAANSNSPGSSAVMAAVQFHQNSKIRAIKPLL